MLHGSVIDVSFFWVIAVPGRNTYARVHARMYALRRARTHTHTHTHTQTHTHTHIYIYIDI